MHVWFNDLGYECGWVFALTHAHTHTHTHTHTPHTNTHTHTHTHTHTQVMGGKRQAVGDYDPSGTHFTCFTITKVQILTQEVPRAPRARLRCSVYLLYWYKSTNADSEVLRGTATSALKILVANKSAGRSVVQ